MLVDKFVYDGIANPLSSCLISSVILVISLFSHERMRSPLSYKCEFMTAQRKEREEKQAIDRKKVDYHSRRCNTVYCVFRL